MISEKINGEWSIKIGNWCIIVRDYGGDMSQLEDLFDEMKRVMFGKNVDYE